MAEEKITEREGLERLESLFREKNFKEAAAFAADLRERFPSSYQIGYLFYQILVNLEKYSESESLLDELLKKYPENIKLLLEKGAILINRGKMAESRLFFDKVLFLDPFNLKAKEGVDRIKKKDSEPVIEMKKYVKQRTPLEDTMKESDLERFLGGNGEPRIIRADSGNEESEEDLDISMSESGIGFEAPLEGPVSTPVKPKGEVKGQEEIVLVGPGLGTQEIETTQTPPVEQMKEEPEEDLAEKVESHLEGLNVFSGSDMEDLGLSGDQAEDPAGEKEDDTEEGFITESAALLYLKQELYEDAKNIYEKLYRQSDPRLYSEKMSKVKRLEIAGRKIRALENYLTKIKSGSVAIV